MSNDAQIVILIEIAVISALHLCKCGIKTNINLQCMRLVNIISNSLDLPAWFEWAYVQSGGTC